MKTVNQVISDDTLNIVTFAPMMDEVPRAEQMKLFIKQNQHTTKHCLGANLKILFYNGIENEIYITQPGENEIEINGNMVQITTEDLNGLAGSPNYVSSFDLHLRDILAISLNYQY